MKTRVFSDVLDIPVYAIGARVADNEYDVIYYFDVEGYRIPITVSTAVALDIDRLRNKVIQGHNGKRFYTDEERAAFEAEYAALNGALYTGVAGMVYDAWRKCVDNESDTNNKEKNNG